MKAFSTAQKHRLLGELNRFLKFWIDSWAYLVELRMRMGVVLRSRTSGGVFAARSMSQLSLEGFKELFGEEKDDR